MRLIPRHGEAGYVEPQKRASCRTCRHLQASEEYGLGLATYWSCRQHGFEVRQGGVCDTYAAWGARPTVADVKTRDLFVSPLAYAARYEPLPGVGSTA